LNYRKIIAFALCVVTLCLPLASCAGKDKPVDGGETSPGISAKSSGAINFEGAYKRYAPTDVMLVSSDGKLSANWDLMYYYICLAIEEIYYNTGAYPDLSDTTETGFITQIITRAEEGVLACLAIEYAAANVNAVITDDDLASIALGMELAEEREGGAEGFRSFLADNHLSYEAYLYLVRVIDYLYENTVLATYGEGAKLFSDADTAAFFEDTEHFTVKSIFFSTTELDGIKPLDDAEIQEKQTEANHVLELLWSFEGNDFDAYFDSLMFEYSEDTTALNVFPDGYLITADQTYPELYAAVSALKIGEVSEVIASEFGFHIVYHLPVNYDIIPPTGVAWDTKNTLRSQAARDMFGQYVEALRSELGETASGDFYNLDLAELFK